MCKIQRLDEFGILIAGNQLVWEAIKPDSLFGGQSTHVLFDKTVLLCRCDVFAFV